MITAIITYHFFKGDEEKAKQFLHIILGNKNVSFFIKSNMVNSIIKMYYPLFLDANPKILDELDKMMELRNKLAHYQFYPQLDNAELFVEFATLITLDSNNKKKKNKVVMGLKKEEFTAARIEENFKRLNKLSHGLTMLLSAIMEKESDPA